MTQESFSGISPEEIVEEGLKPESYKSLPLEKSLDVKIVDSRHLAFEAALITQLQREEAGLDMDRTS